MSDLPYIISFSVFPGIGYSRFKLLYTYFGSAERAWNAEEKALEIVGLPSKLISDFIHFRSIFSIDDYQKTLKRKQVKVIPFTDNAFPERLKECADAPFLLYYFGNGDVTLLSQERMIGVVGTRMVTSYGRQITEQIVTDLVHAGCCIVSGMALGVDAVAHTAALDANGITIAVLGCGVDIIAPASNTSLYHRIARTGLIVSEMPIGHQPLRGLFPARNRIISGLSAGVIVTEGTEKSGSLITASNAAEQGRDVFAVPGPVTSLLSKGPAKLIKSGATLIESAEDVLRELQYAHGKNSFTRIFPQEIIWIIELLKKRPHHIDEIVRAGTIHKADIYVVLMKLEMSGVIKKIENEEYVLL